MLGQEELYNWLEKLFCLTRCILRKENILNMNKRPILTILVGYIIGIIWGLYNEFSIVLLYFPIIAIYFFISKFRNRKTKIQNNKLKLLSLKRYVRYLKIFFNRKVIFIVLITSIISNTIVKIQNKNYDNLYEDEQKLILVATIVSNKEEKEFKNVYKIKVDKVINQNTSKDYENSQLLLNVDKNEDINLKYGDKIYIKAEYTKPSTKRNFGGFDYSSYLKSINVYGTLKAEEIRMISENNVNMISLLSNKVKLKITDNINKLMPEKYSSIFLGLILGDTKNIEESIQNSFKIANISHVLAISGMHITYIILGVELILKKILGKRKTRIVTLFILIIYMFITGFSPSIVRASIMGILVIISKLIYRKNDIYTSIAFSLLILLIYNPFLITNVGLQLSYLGTIGIIVFNKNIYNFFRNIKIKNKKIKYRINRKIILLVDNVKQILSVTFSAQIMILPILLYHFNMLGIYFFISNLLVSVIIGPIIIIGFICVIISFISIEIAKFFSGVVLLGIKILIFISEVSNLPFSKIYISTPRVWQIIIYYIFILIVNIIYNAFSLKNPNYTEIRVKNLFSLMKYKLNQNKKKIVKVILFFSILIFIYNIIPKNLKIHFVDVGQGDCTFIVTPCNKTILIDGGGSTSKEYNVGESVVLPYILDRGYTKIDYLFISHFDQDHVGGILTILEELKIGKIFISKQIENSENYQKFLSIVKDKKINVKIVKQGDKIKIEKNLYFDILWPIEEQIQENVLNNNALVFKLQYNDFSMLFTGDIEEIAEEKILTLYGKNVEKLKSTVLKIAHHGSKTSTTEEFLKVVNPKICLIGVGENNMFGHPADEIIKRLEEFGLQIFRTDENGEISIYVSLFSAKVNVTR